MRADIFLFTGKSSSNSSLLPNIVLSNLEVIRYFKIDSDERKGEKKGKIER